jgi:aminoglycoside 3-N-acetyltransferase
MQIENKTTALFTNDSGQPVAAFDFVRGLRAAGVKAGDTIFVHSEITAFGRLALFDRNKVFASLVGTLFEAIGERGTLLMPAFTYSFCNNEVFDRQRSPSKVGVLTEFFRTLPEAARTLQPIFSVCVAGHEKSAFADVSSDCFDESSIFGLLDRYNAKLLFFGAPIEACTFVHYIEQTHGVDYRYFKTFKGIVVDNGVEFESACRYYVRDLARDPQLDLATLKQLALRSGAAKESEVGHGKLLVIHAKELLSIGLELLSSNPHALVNIRR